MIRIRKGQAPARLARAEFSVRVRASFVDPEFRAEDPSIARLEDIAWRAYTDGRKAPFTRKAGPGYPCRICDIPMPSLPVLASGWRHRDNPINLPALRLDHGQSRHCGSLIAWTSPIQPSRVCMSARPY